MSTTQEHWLVALRLQERANNEPAAEPVAEASSLLPPKDIALKAPAWTRDCVAKAYGYPSTQEMREDKQDKEVSGYSHVSMVEAAVDARSRWPWRPKQRVQVDTSSLAPNQTTTPESRSRSGVGLKIATASSASSAPSAALILAASRKGSNESNKVHTIHNSDSTTTLSSEQESNSKTTPSLSDQSRNNGKPKLPSPLQAQQSSTTTNQRHTVVLYEDLTSLFIYHTQIYAQYSTSNTEAASALTNDEMQALMSRYEASLSLFKCRSDTLIPLYSGMSERIKLGIIYCAYIASEREHFSDSESDTDASSSFSYLGPKTYLASRLRRQRVSAEMPMMFRNKQTLCRELETVVWGRRRWLVILDYFPEQVARMMWRFDPTFTYKQVAPSCPSRALANH